MSAVDVNGRCAVLTIPASAAGHSVANGIANNLPENYRVILVERNTYVVWSPGTVRQIVVPGWEDKNFQVEVKQERFFPAGSRHQVLCPNSVVELKKNSVVLEKPFEGSTELPFEVCFWPLRSADNIRSASSPRVPSSPRQSVPSPAAASKTSRRTCARCRMRSRKRRRS